MLRAMAALLEVKGEVGYKVRAYEKAAQSIERGDFPLESLARSNSLEDIPGVGRNLAPKIRQIVLEGKSDFLERLVGEIPVGLLDLLNVPGIGPKTARRLFDTLGVENLDDLQVALDTHRVRELPGLGKKSEEFMALGLAEVKKYAGRQTLEGALAVGRDVVRRLKDLGFYGEIVGELRRFVEAVASIDVLVMAERDAGPSIVEKMGYPRPEGVSDRYSLDVSFGVPLNIYVEARDRFFLRQLFLTGPGDYVAFLQKRAEKAGYELGEEGLFKEGKLVALESEEHLYHLTGVHRVPPEARHLKEALEGPLDLVSFSEVMGDLHVHTVWSDGISSIEDMVKAAIDLGYSYLAITDHASTMTMINGLTPDRLKAQLSEIDSVSRRFPGFTVLKGVEVDILKDGTLFLEDDLLSQLDVVVASVHDDVVDKAGEVENRLLKAIANPHVDIIGHPSGRIPGRRPRAATDFTRVFQAAGDTGTLMEINGKRLDLSEDMVEKAKDCGVRFAVNSDAHSKDGLVVLEMGILSCARRAGLGKESVANAWPWPPRS